MNEGKPDVRRVVAVTIALLMTGCAGGPATGPTGRLDIAVAPLSLPGVSDAVYTLTVSNGVGEVVWSKQVASSAYGDGAGSVSYVGTCDAADGVQQNTIALVLDSLTVEGGATLTAGVDFANPAPASDPIALVRTCVADRDVAVDFEVTVARAAQQGFFDVAISLSDVFCSAKLDCENAGGPLELLSNPATGERDLTAVLGFACTAGPGQETWLHMDEVVVTCGGNGGATFTVSPAGDLGNQNPAFSNANTELLFQAAVYRGDEQLPGYSKGYWNVALGLNAGAFATLSPCALTASASASSSAFDAGDTPAGVRWPFIAWDVPLTDATGAFVCTTHEVGGGDVEAAYTDTAGHRFYASRHVGDPTVTLGQIAPVAFGAALHYADGTFAATCDDYLHPTLPYVYADIGSGVYTIDPDGAGLAAPYDVYCDMTTDGGGWTMLLNLDTSDGHVMWWDNALWTDANVYGDVATPFSGDHKSEAYNSLDGTTEVLLAVHQQGSYVGWKAFAKSGTGTLRSYMTTGADDVTLGTSVTASDTAAIWQYEALVRNSTTLVANYCIELSGSCIPYTGGSPDGHRLGSGEAQASNNVGGGIGNWADMGYCCSGQSYASAGCNGSTFRTCSEAQAGWSPSYLSGNHGTFGTDSCFPMTNSLTDSSCTGANWAQANGVAYDYALFVR